LTGTELMWWLEQANRIAARKRDEAEAAQESARTMRYR